MTLQEEIVFDEYFRCYAIGRKYVHIMRYDPRRPHHERYVKDGPPIDPAMHERVHGDCLKLMNALGYDFCTLEFAVRDGIPYAIDFLNPAPDAAVESVGPENFEWVVEHATKWLIERVAAARRASDRVPLADVPRRRERVAPAKKSNGRPRKPAAPREPASGSAPRGPRREA